MKRKALLLLCVLLAPLLIAQTGYVVVTASNIATAAGGKLGTPIAPGYVCAQPVDSNNRPIVARYGGSGRQIQGLRNCATVVNGTIQGTYKLPDIALTAPTNVCLRLTFKDATGNSVTPPGYTCVQPSSGSSASTWCSVNSIGTFCNLDLYAPNVATQAIIQNSPPGPIGPMGPIREGDLGVYASNFNGSSPGAKIDAACAAYAGSPGTVIVPKTLGSGDSIAGLPSNCHLLDFRGNSLIQAYGGLSSPAESHGLVIRSTESTPASQTTYNGFLNLQLAYESVAGGVYNFNFLSGEKANHINLQLNSGFRTISQNLGIYNNLWVTAPGDTLPLYQQVHQYGGYGTSGDEGTVGVEQYLSQGYARGGNATGG